MNVLDNIDLIKQIDTEDMYHKIIHMPEHILEAYFKANIHHFEKNPQTKINKVIISGMGGSAIAGDIIYALYNQNISINIVKDYYLPYCDENTLFIACSYSGDTEETVACLKTAIEKKAIIWGVTTGGKVKSIIDNLYPWLELKPGFPPRSAIAWLFFSVLKVLELNGIVEDQTKAVNKVAAALMMKAGAVAKSVPSTQNFAKSSAENLNGKIPLLYSSNPVLSAVAYRWKCQINENTKYPAYFHTFPEMNHNEIEAWENKSFNNHFMPVFLRFFNEENNYEKRIRVFKKLLNEQNIDYLEFFADGDIPLTKVFSLIYLGDMISFYLAILNQTNPTTINFINYLKQNI